MERHDVGISSGVSNSGHRLRGNTVIWNRKVGAVSSFQVPFCHRSNDSKASLSSDSETAGNVKAFQRWGKQRRGLNRGEEELRAR